MRFSLRTLLLFFPALLVTYGLAYLLGGIVFWHTGRHGAWHHEENQLRRLHDFANNPSALFNSSKSSMFTWLNGSLRLGQSPAVQQLCGYLETNDAWGNPYRCVCLDAQLTKTAVNQVAVIGIYSVGEDGISLSEGNDPDDLKSWSFDLSYYHRRSAERDLWEQRVNALWMMPVVVVMLAFLWGVLNFVRLLLRGPRSFEWERTLNRR